MSSIAARSAIGIAATAAGAFLLFGEGQHRRRVEADFPGTAAKVAAAKKLVQPPTLKVTYFDFNPRFAGTAGEQLRIALALTVGIDAFEDDRVVFSTWADRKPNMKYGQMPVVTINGRDKYQSGSTLRYIGSTLGDGSLYPTDDPIVRLRIDEMIGFADDLQKAWNPSYIVDRFPNWLGYAEKDDDRTKRIRDNFFANEFPKYMKVLTKRLKATGSFIAGEKLTIADCRMFPQLDYFRRGNGDFLPQNCLDEYPEVVAYLDRLRQVPEFRDWPYNNKNQ